MAGDTFYVAGHIGIDQYPARAFIGINKLVRGGHFEVAGIAAKPPAPRKP
jgi:enamine deaminase RidA (YjgF/YER057c/UK114 family)